MRLFEIVSPSFFVVTSRDHKIGCKISVLGSVHPLGAALEGRLEGTRPDGLLPRDKSLYLHASAPSRGDYVYEVEPVGQVDRHHLAWLRQLREVSFGSVGAVDQLCHAYWSGKECPEERDLPWEYRALEAIVLRRVGGTALRRTG